MLFVVLLGSKMSPNIDILFFLLVFWRYIFLRSILECFLLGLGSMLVGPTLNPLAMAQSKCTSALFRILGKKHTKCSKIDQKIAPKSSKFIKNGVWKCSCFCIRLLVTFSQIWAPFWLPFGSILDTLGHFGASKKQMLSHRHAGDIHRSTLAPF